LQVVALETVPDTATDTAPLVAMPENDCVPENVIIPPETVPEPVVYVMSRVSVPPLPVSTTGHVCFGASEAMSPLVEYESEHPAPPVPSWPPSTDGKTMVTGSSTSTSMTTVEAYESVKVVPFVGDVSVYVDVVVQLQLPLKGLGPDDELLHAATARAARGANRAPRRTGRRRFMRRRV
jgi:hypothetical protein